MKKETKEDVKFPDKKKVLEKVFTVINDQQSKSKSKEILRTIKLGTSHCFVIELPLYNDEETNSKSMDLIAQLIKKLLLEHLHKSLPVTQIQGSNIFVTIKE